MALDLRGGNSILGLMGHIQQQGELGAQKANERGLASLLSKSMTANPQDRRALLAKGAAIDPKGTMEVAGLLQGQEEDALDRFGKLSSAYANSKDPHLARQWVQAGVELNLLPPEALQRDYNNPQEIEGSARAAMAIANAYGQRAGMPAGVQEFQFMTQGLTPEDQLAARRIGLGLDPRASSAAIKYMEVEGADGRTRIVAMDPRDVGAQVIGGGEMYGSGVPSPQGGDPFGFLAQAGATVTSAKRSPEHNAKVGGVPNSYHLSGQARDILPPTDPQQAAFIRQQAQANGLEVIDEGDHWHLEPARRQPQGANPFVGRRPEDEAASVAAAKKAVDLSFLPAELQLKVQAAIEQAGGKAQVQADVKRGVDQRGKETAYAQFEQAMRGVESALAGTMTNPVVGALPALTSNQQEAEGSVAAMAPILKQLFRSAGEGVFTDKDQELLMRMMPTRSDYGPARAAKIANIRAIVAAKLGVGAAREDAGEASDDIDSLLGKYGIR